VESLNLLVDNRFVEISAYLIAIVFVAYFAFPLANWIIQHSFKKWRNLAKAVWIDILLSSDVGKRIAQISPSLIIQISIELVPYISGDVVAIIRNVAVAVTILYTIRVLLAILDGVQEAQFLAASVSDAKPKAIKSYIQLGKIVLIALGAIVIVSALIDRSPFILLSGLGAMSAVLLIVFKDTLVSFTAGLQLTTNDMLRVGDWIEMPQVGADGEVIDIALHTVTIQNWDNTITAIPTWRLMSESFKNWRGMSDSGGRRIKKTLLVDATSISFLGVEDVSRLMEISLINVYLNEKSKSIKVDNDHLEKRIGNFSTNPSNQRRLTNLGTFRAYVNLYLAANPNIHKKMTRIVRLLKPSSDGVPLEIYCFTTTTAWADYESIQSDIFEHLLAILPEFGLRTYQKPSGHDLKSSFISHE
tara:strand:- start:8 stop:1255 length:1248 start_codon:yes stop_codon:yes gene_type:complete